MEYLKETSSDRIAIKPGTKIRLKNLLSRNETMDDLLNKMADLYIKVHHIKMGGINGKES